MKTGYMNGIFNLIQKAKTINFFFVEQNKEIYNFFFLQHSPISNMQNVVKHKSALFIVYRTLYGMICTKFKKKLFLLLT